MCDQQGPWDPEKTPKCRLNFCVLFGFIRDKLKQVLLGDCDSNDFQILFDRVASRAKIKIRPGRWYSKDKVEKPKRRHIFRRVC